MKRIFIPAAFLVGLLILFLSGIIVPKFGFFSPNILKVFSLNSLIKENTILKKELLDAENRMRALQEEYQFLDDVDYITARVFSLYPFNIKNRIYLNVGTDEGVSVADSVTFSKTVLIGQVVRTARNESEIVTLFDSQFSLPVRIGDKEVEGLLEGGVNPKIGLIDKTKHVSSGDIITAAARNIPYGLEIGSVSSVKEGESGAFLEASVDLPYTLSELKKVYVTRGYGF